MTVPSTEQADPGTLIGRRWKRYNLDLPVVLRVSRPDGSRTIYGRGRKLNEGGLAVFAGVELEVGSKFELELTLPCASVPLKLHALVRNRAAYHYGLEFVTTTGEQERKVALLRLFIHRLTRHPSGSSAPQA